LFQQNLDSSNALKRWQVGSLKGVPGAADEAVARNTADAWAHRITGLSREDPWKAGKMLDEHRQELGMLGDQVENTVRTQQRTAGARNISDRVNVDLKNPESPDQPEKSLADRVKEARTMAKSLNPKDELLQDYAEQRVIADYSQHKKVTADDAWRNGNIVDNALVGVGAHGGQLPTTIEQLKGLNPKVGAAFDALPDPTKMRIMKNLAQNARIPEQERSAYEHSEEGLERFKILKGLAFNDAKSFLAISIPNEKFTSATRKSLITQQEQLKAKAEADPRVQDVLEHLRVSMGPDMQALGIYHRNTKDPDSYDHFVGALQQAVDQYWDTHKKRPDAKAIDEMGSTLLRQTQTPGTIFGRFWPSTGPPMYEVPQEKIDALKAETVKRGGTEPTDTEARRALMRQHFKDFYGGQ
jgi:DNA-binding transcriptional ArsR family regulator